MTAIHTERIDIRTSPENKVLLVQAAELLGLNLSSFAVSTLVEAAQKVVDRHAAITMTDTDRDAFLSMMDNPPAPSAKLLRAAQRHRESVGE